MTKFCHNSEGHFANRPKIVAVCTRKRFFPLQLCFRGEMGNAGSQICPAAINRPRIGLLHNKRIPGAETWNVWLKINRIVSVAFSLLVFQATNTIPIGLRF